LQGNIIIGSLLCLELRSRQDFRLLTFRMLPMMPATSVEFSTHTWAGVIKHLTQVCSDGMDCRPMHE
jgi:hypothetical protein